MTLPRAVWLSALAAFESAARHQNFARAGEELHLTAGAVGHHVRKLEAQLGLPLFQRHARGVALTAEGRLLADAAGSTLSDLDTVFASVRPDRRSAVVRVATLHSFAHAWLIPRLASFFATHPGIRLSIETEIALTRFDHGGPDLGIRHGPGSWPGLVAERLLDETLFPVMATADPQVADIAGVAGIARLPLLADLARQGWQDWFRHAGLRRQPPAPRLTFTDSTDALQAAACGLGVALARSHIVAPWLADGRLQRLPGPALPARFAYFLVQPESRPASEPARLFARWLLGQVAADEASSGAAAPGDSAIRLRRNPAR